MYAFIGGMPEWHQFNYPVTENKRWQEIHVAKIPPKEVSEKLSDQTIYLLDVRPVDFTLDNAFLRGSFHCPLVYLEESCAKIPKERKIIITDWTMKQSPSAAKFLTEKGYIIVGVLKGGVERWKAENFPVEERVDTSSLPSTGR